MGTAINYTIVVGIDFTDASEHALRHAATIAQRFSSTALQLINVVDPRAPGLLGAGDGNASQVAGRAEEVPGKLAQWLRDRSTLITALRGHPIGLHVRVGDAADTIVAFARDVSADLIVVGSQGRNGIKAKLLGSVADQVVQKSDRPVIVATPPDPSVQIEPPCPQCVDKRFTTKGAEWWCDAHRDHHVRAHAWSYQRELPLDYPDADVVPTGLHVARS